jgi:hypothetical protein
MRYLLFIFSFISSCGSDSTIDYHTFATDSTVNLSKKIVCNQNYDSSLVRYANDFSPTTIDLNSSLSSDLKSFLMSVDTSCLRKQTKYKYFIALILQKLALHHLKCCNQQYDLYQMREGAATLIINEFNNLAGYEGKRLEMLNSGLITEYIKKDSELSKIPIMKDAINATMEEERRIEKGVF